MNDGYVASSDSVKPMSPAELAQLQQAPRKSTLSLSYPHKSTPQAQAGTRREQVTSTVAEPFSSICQIMATAPSGEQFYGSGWIVGRRTVITAGHVVYVRGVGWMRDIKVYPGVNGTGFIPAQFSGSAWNTTDQFRTSTMADAAAAEQFDFGVIQIDGDFSGTAAPLPFNAYAAADLEGGAASVIGYPTDEPWGTQWGNTNKIIAVEGGQLRYNITTTSGDSGSPVYSSFHQVVGIHNYGDVDYNLGTWISVSVYDKIQAWIRQYD